MSATRMLACIPLSKSTPLIISLSNGERVINRGVFKTVTVSLLQNRLQLQRVHRLQRIWRTAAVARSDGSGLQVHGGLTTDARDCRGGPRVFKVASCTALVACLPRPRWIIPWPGTRSVHTPCPSLHGWMEYKVNRHNHSGMQGTVACHSMTRSSAPSILRSHPRITPRVTQAPDPCRRTCRPPRRQPRTHVCCLCHRTHPRLCLKVNLLIGPTACKLTALALCRRRLLPGAAAVPAREFEECGTGADVGDANGLC